MRGVVACLWVVAAACSFDPATVDAGGGGGGGGGGGSSGGGSGQSCFAGSSDFAFCITTPTQPITLATSGKAFDTGAADMQNGCTLGTYAMVGSAEACVIAGTTVTIAAQTSFVAVDAYPLVIAATGDVEIAGLLDVSTPSGGQHGAGFNATECKDAGIDGGSYQFGASGGAGGSFGTPGGAGGDGAEDDRGVAQPAVSATRLRGGCRGGTGGGGNGTSSGGNAGYGGGAVLVAAYGGISVSGAINASGERGYPGQTQGGGGAGGSGGASGGMIVLAATSYEITGALVANGGGGGGGGGENGAEGQPGMGGIASITSPSLAASGGSGAGEGGSGGTGAAGAAAAMAGVSSTANGAGGGGGGGVGVIGYLGGMFPPAASNVSPPAMPL